MYMHACGCMYRDGHDCLYVYMSIKLHISTFIITLMNTIFNHHICTWLSV